MAAGPARGDSQTVIGPARPEDLMTMAFSQPQPQSQPQQSPSAADQSAQQNGNVEWFNHEGLEVLTVGHIMPRVEGGSPVENFPPINASVTTQAQLNGELEVEEQVMPTGVPQPTVNSNGVVGGPRLRVRRKTYVPGWAVPPRVLLVEDDAVSRKLSSKFLQVLGVTTDFAVDGESAVKQMHLGQYDLVLMVRPLSPPSRVSPLLT
jgi:osomolarity two-component system response regulator SKN7